ncbi:MAG: HAD-IIB family hydrolase [Desulfatibacillaceae bacterium]
MADPSPKKPVVFTDLDGTLLDHDTYSWRAAAPALGACRARHVPVVMVSSKTRAEMEPLGSELGIEAPFAVENGGAVYLPRKEFPEPPEGGREDGPWWRIEPGSPYREIVPALEEISGKLGVRLEGFAGMSVDRIMEVTGLDREGARLAAAREYDEPFVAPRTGMEAMLAKAAASRGLRVSGGGRFFHLHGDNDKGRAVRLVVEAYGKRGLEVVSAGLGDSHNDESMLKVVDHPYFVGPPERTPRDIPRLVVTKRTGPEGWNLAVLDFLSWCAGRGRGTP